MSLRESKRHLYQRKGRVRIVVNVFHVFNTFRILNLTIQRRSLKYKLDSQAVEATQSIGMAKSDYMRYGGPYRAFETMVYPFMHLPEAQDQIAKFSSNL